MSSSSTVDNLWGHEDFPVEKHRQNLADALSEMRKNIEMVLEMRVQAAELELSLASCYNPKLQAKMKVCQETAEKCECKVSSTTING